MEVSGQLHPPAALLPENQPPGSHWIGGWVGPRAGLGTVAKKKILSSCRKSNLYRSAGGLVIILTELSRLINWHSVFQ